MTSPDAMDFSVLIPTRDRPDDLHVLLESLRTVETPLRGEIIVLNNGTSHLDAVPEGMWGSFILRKVGVPEPGLHNGRNTGARVAHGVVLAYLDDDTEVTPGWWKGVEPVLNGEADAVAGRILPRWLGDEPPAWVSAYYKDGVCGYLTLLDLGIESKAVDFAYVWGANFMVRRDLVLKLGGFPPDGMPQELIHLRGDGETGFFRKFSQAGYRCRYEPKALVYHRVPAERLTIKYFCQRAYNQGVSDSFSMLHRNHSRGGILSFTPNEAKCCRGSCVSRVVAGLGWRWRALKVRVLLKRQRSQEASYVNSGAFSFVHTQLREAELDGFKFHHNYVMTHPEMMKWITQDNWLTY